MYFKQVCACGKGTVILNSVLKFITLNILTYEEFKVRLPGFKKQMQVESVYNGNPFDEWF